MRINDKDDNGNRSPAEAAVGLRRRLKVGERAAALPTPF